MSRVWPFHRRPGTPDPDIERRASDAAAATAKATLELEQAFARIAPALDNLPGMVQPPAKGPRR